MAHQQKTKAQAKYLTEIEGLNPRQIEERLGVPKITIWSWVNKYNWKVQELTTENVLVNELKRVIVKPEYTDQELRKIRILRDLLDEYSSRRSALVIELETLIKKHRSTPTEKQALVNDLVGLLNTFTGSTLKQMKAATTDKINDFSRYQE